MDSIIVIIIISILIVTMARIVICIISQLWTSHHRHHHHPHLICHHCQNCHWHHQSTMESLSVIIIVTFGITACQHIATTHIPSSVNYGQHCHHHHPFSNWHHCIVITRRSAMLLQLQGGCRITSRRRRLIIRLFKAGFGLSLDTRKTKMSTLDNSRSEGLVQM